MATVVITFFLFVRFYVCKMDADYIENQRDQLLSRREKRWSMNSQRVEEIVAELMRPISSDARRYFDTDLAALLEEYLTEAGLHALDASEDGEDAATAPPNYAELALLLQQSATIYGRKVDFLYQHVMDVSEALHANALDPAPGAATPGAEAGAAPAPAARTPARAAPPRDEFARTASPWDAHRFAREPAARRPHPTLPRFFMELEPRLGSDASWQALRDHAGELVGLLDDFQANMEQDPHSGMLVDDWFDVRTDREQQGPPAISMLELQAAIDAAAPPPLAPAGPLASPPSSPLRTSTPLPPEPSLDASAATDASVATTDASAAATDASAAATDTSAEPDTSAELTLPTPVKKERKRRHSLINIDDIFEGVKLMISEDLRKELKETREFSIPTTWIRREVKKRMSHILSERRRLRELEPDPRAEFAGWSAAEAAEAAARAKGGRAGEPDSDDDGFFEQSSVGDGCDTSRVEDGARADEGARAGPAGPAWAAWQAGVLSRAAAAEARGLDVRALGRDVLRALPGDAPAHFDDVLRRTARADREVSHVLLATLFLANAGNVRVLPGAGAGMRAEPGAGAGMRAEPGAGAGMRAEGFSLQLLSPDERLYSAAAAAEQFLR